MVKMKYNKIVLFLICFYLESCNMSDYTENIVAGYQLCHEAEDNNFILGKHEILPNIVACDHNDDFIIAKQEPNVEDIKISVAGDLYSKYVAFCNYLTRDTTMVITDDYSLVLPKNKSDSILIRSFYQHGITINNTLSDIEKSKLITDSFLSNDDYYKKVLSSKINYWIILLKSDSLVGPLSKDEYVHARIEFNIPKKLELNEFVK